MSQDQLFKLACAKCDRINYWSRKNKKLVTKK
ncbi:50S ribosomal protein L33, partial [Candidatus Kaiserbacteria bacterium]|nr:50S ribosomal protein L33 [Candidatus Kaiserbacteria bacterium]